MKRRILSLILSIAMLAGMFAFAAIHVSAATDLDTLTVTVNGTTGVITVTQSATGAFAYKVADASTFDDTACALITTVTTDGFAALTSGSTALTTADNGKFVIVVDVKDSAGAAYGVSIAINITSSGGGTTPTTPIDSTLYSKVKSKDWTYNGLTALGMEIDLRAAIIEPNDAIAAGGTPTVGGIAKDIFDLVDSDTSGSLTNTTDGKIADLNDLILASGGASGLTVDIIDLEIAITKLNIQIDIMERLIKGVDEVVPDNTLTGNVGNFSASKVYAEQTDVTAAEQALATAKNAVKVAEDAIKLATEARDKAIEVVSKANQEIQPALDAIEDAITAAVAAYDAGNKKSGAAVKTIIAGLGAKGLTVADYADPDELEAAEKAIADVKTAVDKVVAAYKVISAIEAEVDNMTDVATAAQTKSGIDATAADGAVTAITNAVTIFKGKRLVGTLAATRFDISLATTPILPNMKFGTTTGGAIITPDIDDDVMSGNVVSELPGTYQVVVSSSDEKVVTIEPGSATGTYNVIAQGKGTATITLEVVPLDKERFPVGYPVLKGDKKTFKVTVQRADTTNAVTSTPATPVFTVVSTATGIATIPDSAVVVGTDSDVTLDFMNEVAYMSTTPATGVDTIAGYSLDGSKWTSLSVKYWDGNSGSGSAALEGVDISKILDKGASNLQFASRLEGNSPAAGATIWEVGKINARPKTAKINIKYETEASGGKYHWTFDVKDLSKLLFASSKDGSTPDKTSTTKPNTEFGFTTPVAGDAKLEVQATPAGEKTQKYNYLVKTMPVMTVTAPADPILVTPASKVTNVKVSGELKAPTAKVDYKKEKVNIKAGLEYYVGARDLTTHTATWIEMKKPLVKEGVTFVTVFGAAPAVGAKQSVYVRTLPTEKKPPSAVAEIKVNGPKAWAADLGAAADGKYKLPKGLEARKVGTTKWVTSIKVSATENYEVREKATAKFDAKESANNLKGLTASEIKKVTITWGDIDTGKTDSEGIAITKKGIVSVALQP